jgi:hypothetical protein
LPLLSVIFPLFFFFLSHRLILQKKKEKYVDRNRNQRQKGKTIFDDSFFFQIDWTFFSSSELMMKTMNPMELLKQQQVQKRRHHQ